MYLTKILYIAHDSNIFGGANMALLELIDSLDKKLFKSVVLVPDDNGEMINELKKRNVKFIVFKYGWCAFHKSKSNFRNILRYLNLILKQLSLLIRINKLNKLINKENFDIIHSNSSVINIGALISKRTKIKHIWHIREFGEEHLNMHFIFGKKITRKYMVANCDKMLFISKALYKKYINIVNSNKMIVVYDGVSSKYFNYNKKDNFNDEFAIIQVANIQSGKGQLELIKAVLELNDMGRDITLNLVGGIGEENYYKKILSIIKENNKIILHGRIADINKLNRLRREANCEVICSDMEAFGRVTVEAMLSCLPVIASNSGANNELIQDNINGLKYRINDKNDLKKKISYMQKNKENRICMGQNGYKIACKNYTQEINARNIESIYKKVLYEKGDV